jgi:S1-C subfamily serine protease
MMRTLLCLLLSACVAWAGGKESSVTVVIESLKGGSGHGSGCCVANDGKAVSLILTNRHVVQNADKVWIIQNGKLVKGLVIFVNDGPDDLAAFTVPVLIPRVTLAPGNPALGTEVSCYGSTSGPQKGTIKGSLELVYGDGRKETVMSSSLLSIPGDSGAGVFDAKDQLVSLNTGLLGTMEQGYQIGIPVESIRDVMTNKVKDWVIR